MRLHSCVQQTSQLLTQICLVNFALDVAVPTVSIRVSAHPLMSPQCRCCRFTLLCSLEGGRLQLVDVQPPGHPHIRTLPLSVQPTKVALLRHSGLVQDSSLPLLLVLGSQPGRSEAKESAPLQCLLGIHPTTGGWFWRTAATHYVACFHFCRLLRSVAVLMLVLWGTELA